MFRNQPFFLKITIILCGIILLTSCSNKVQFAGSTSAGSTSAGNGVLKDPNGPNTPNGPNAPSTPSSPTDPNYLEESLIAPDPAVRSVDILFIDDNSGSMVPDQQNIASKFQNFISQLQNVDWQIGITTTDVTSNGLDGSLSELTGGPGSHILTPGVNAQTLFENTIQRPEVGDGNERAIIAIQHAIQKRNNTENAGFFRPGAALAVVIISDEDENSDQYGRTINNPVPSGYQTWSSQDEPSTLIKTFSSVFPGKSLTVNSIHVMPGDANCLQIQKNQSGAEQTAHYANVYSEIVNQTGGAMGSICDTNFTGPLSQIGQNINAQLTSVTLKEVPDPASLILTISPNDPTIHWTLSGNKIFFDKALAKNTGIHVYYKKP